MKCPKCAFITFDYIKECPKCGTPAPKEVEFLYPLRFKPNPPDFGTDYLEALGSISFVRAEEVSRPESVEEISLEELSQEEGSVDTGLEIKLDTVEAQDLDKIPILKEEGLFQRIEEDTERVSEAGWKEIPLELKVDELTLETPKTEEIPSIEELELKVEDISQEEEIRVPLLKVDSEELRLTLEEEKGRQMEGALKELDLENLKLELEEDEIEELKIDIDLEEHR